jgi:hypothetical protein
MATIHAGFDAAKAYTNVGLVENLCQSNIFPPTVVMDRSGSSSSLLSTGRAYSILPKITNEDITPRAVGMFRVFLFAIRITK